MTIAGCFQLLEAHLDFSTVELVPDWDDIVDPENEEHRQELLRIAEAILAKRQGIYDEAIRRGALTAEAQAHADRMVVSIAFMLGAIAQRHGMLDG